MTESELSEQLLEMLFGVPRKNPIQSRLTSSIANFTAAIVIMDRQAVEDKELFVKECERLIDVAHKRVDDSLPAGQKFSKLYMMLLSAKEMCVEWQTKLGTMIAFEVTQQPKPSVVDDDPDRTDDTGMTARENQEASGIENLTE